MTTKITTQAPIMTTPRGATVHKENALFNLPVTETVPKEVLTRTVEGLSIARCVNEIKAHKDLRAAQIRGHNDRLAEIDELIKYWEGILAKATKLVDGMEYIEPEQA